MGIVFLKQMNLQMSQLQKQELPQEEVPKDSTIHYHQVSGLSKLMQDHLNMVLQVSELLVSMIWLKIFFGQQSQVKILQAEHFQVITQQLSLIHI